MARGVEIEWTSKDEQVARTLQRTEQGMEALMRKMDKVEAASRKATQTTETGFDKATKKVAGMAQALIGGGSLLTAVDMVKRANEEMIRQADEAAKKYDDLFRQFRAQAGLNEIQGAEAQRWILANAERNAVSAEVAKSAAGGLVSAGFSTEDSTKGALNVLLRAQSAFIARGKAPGDSETLAKNLAAYMDSQGMAKTPQNLERALQDAFALRAGAFELSDFSELGKHGAAFRGRLSQQEQIAAFGSLVDVMPAAEAGTSLRNIVSRLSTAEVGRTSKQALERIGLTPTDVDLVGENFGAALDRIASGLESVPEEQRAGVLKQLFEEAGVAPASVLLQERGRKYVDYQRGMSAAAADYNASANVMQAGPNAAAIRQRIRGERRASERAMHDDLIRTSLDEQLANQGVAPVRRDVASFGYNTLRYFSADPATAAAMTYGTPFGGMTSGPFSDATRTQAQGQLQRDFREPLPVEIVNPGGAPSVQNNAIRGFGR